MPAGAVRLVPFLTASVVVHAIVFVAAGPESLTISTAPSDRGHEVSIRLEAAAPAGAAADSARNSNERSRSREPPSEPEEQEPPEVAQLEFTPEPAYEPVAESADEAADEPEAEPAAEPTPEQHDKPATAADTEPRNDRTETAEAIERTAIDNVNPQRAEQVAEIDDDATGHAHTSSKAQRAEAREAIVAELAKHFRYPRLAQRRGWEGTVVLSVRILPDGRLDDIRITRSSGRALLDRSARQALAGVKRLPQFADRVGEDGLALEIPVTYRLESA